MSICIDISHWQDYPDFIQVYAAGTLGMIHKCTEGCTYIDPNREENCANAYDAGLKISTYFWIKPGDGQAQAEFYLSVLNPVAGERCVIDYEEDGCSLTTLKNAVQALLDYKSDLKVTIYSGHLLKEELNGQKDSFLAENTDLWVAQYCAPEKLSWPEATYPEWKLWQYSETGEVDGINDSFVDLNHYNGSEQEFLAWIGPQTAPIFDPSRNLRAEARRVARRTARRVLHRRGPDVR